MDKIQRLEEIFMSTKMTFIEFAQNVGIKVRELEDIILRKLTPKKRIINKIEKFYNTQKLDCVIVHIKDFGSITYRLTNNGLLSIFEFLYTDITEDTYTFQDIYFEFVKMTCKELKELPEFDGF